MVKLYLDIKGVPLDAILAAYNFKEDAIALKIDLKKQFGSNQSAFLSDLRRS